MSITGNLIQAVLYILVGYAIPILLNKVGVVDVNIYEIIKPIHFLVFYLLSIFIYSVIVCLLFALYGFYKRIDNLYLKTKYTFFESMVFYAILYLLGITILTIAIDNLLLATFALNGEASSYLISIYYVIIVMIASHLMLKNIEKLKVIWKSHILLAAFIALFSFILNSTIVSLFFSQNFLDKEAISKVALNYKNRGKSETEKNKKDFSDNLIITNDYMQKNIDNYLYTLPKDNKLNIELNTSKVSIKKATLDNQDMLFEVNTTSAYARTDYEIKPGIYNLQIFGTTESGDDFSSAKKLTVQYIYNLSEQPNNVLNNWYMKDKSFATVTKDGILLHNQKLIYDSLGYKRRFDGNVSFEFEFTPFSVNNMDMSIYLGERTYIIFDNKYIKLFQKLKNGKNKIQKKVKYQKFVENQKYTIKTERQADKYKVYVNDIEMLVFDDIHDGDIIVGERYKNIGITLPKNSMKILISKIGIR